MGIGQLTDAVRSAARAARTAGVAAARSAWRRGPFLVTGAAAGFVAVWLPVALAGDLLADVDVVVDARVSAGGSMLLYYNERWSDPLTVALEPGVRKAYVFQDLPGRVRFVRLDPVDGPGEIELFGVQIRRDGEPVAVYSAAALATWAISGARTVKADERVLVLESMGTDPVVQNASLDVTAGEDGVLRRAVWLLQRGFFQLLLLLLVVPVCFGARTRSPLAGSVWLAATAAMGYGAGWLAFLASTAAGGGEPPGVAQAVGMAAFRGIDKNLDFRGFFSAVLAAGAVATASTLAWRRVRRRRAADAPATADESRGGPRGGSRCALIVVTVLVALFAAIDLPEVQALQAFVPSHSNGNWDVQNITTWGYLRSLGMWPLRDYWYIYGGFHFMQAATPPDVFLLWAHRLLVVSCCAAAFHALVGPRVAPVIAVAALAYWLGAAGVLVGWHRYAMSLAAVLLWAAALHRRARRWMVLAGLACGDFFFMEPVQLVYAGPPVALLLTAAVAGSQGPAGRRSLLLDAAIGCGIAATLVAGTFVLHASRGSLREFLLFLTTLGEMAKYSMHPADVASWFVTPSLENAALAVTLVLVTLGVAALGTRAPGTGPVLAAVPLALALVPVLVFQKLLTRPHMAEQFAGIAVLGVAVGLALLRGRTLSSPRIRGLAAGAVGCVLAVASTGDHVALRAIERDLRRASDLPGDLLSALDTAAWQRLRDRSFAAGSFEIDGMDGESFRSLFLSRAALARNDDLFVLGDQPYLYIVLGREVPYYISFYNESIRYSQETTVAWLQRHVPGFVVVPQTPVTFDGVPNHVRVPLVFNEVVANYRYHDRVGRYAILVRRTAGEPVDWAFWRTQLGDVVELGYIPGRSEVLADAPGAGPIRHDVLSVTVADASRGRTERLEFDVDPIGRFAVELVVRAGDPSYAVVLDRVWFWHLARSAGLEPRLVAPAPERGVEAELTELRMAEPVLY